MSDGKLLTAKELNSIEKRNRECVPLDGSPLEQDEKDRRDLLEHVFYQHRVIENCTESNRQLREELKKVKALKLASGAEGNCISNTLHRRSKQMTEAGWGYDAHIMESGAQYLELEVEKSRKYYRALAAAKEALEVAGTFTAYDSEAKDRYSFHRSLAYQNALARIAECEKETT